MTVVPRHMTVEYLKELREHGMLMHHHGASPSGADWIHDYLWHEICDLALKTLDSPEYVPHSLEPKTQFLAAVRALVCGGPFDLTDSPKSLVANLQRLVKEVDESRISRERNSDA